MSRLLTAGVLQQAANKKQYALSIDGVDDYVEASDSALPSGSQNRTIELKYKSINFQSPFTFFSYGINLSNKAIELFANTQDILKLGIRGSTVDYTINNMFDMNAHIFSIVLDGTTANDFLLYFDGTLISPDTSNTNTINTSLSHLKLGLNIANNYYEGEQLQYDFRVWNYARTQQQIQDNLNTKLTGTETGLVAYYDFATGSGTTLYDKTANANHGTIYGATWVEL